MNTSERPPGNLRAGFAALFVFSLLGLALEAFHGFKLRFYLDVDSETRRLLWRLGHAHGTLLGLVNIAYALSARAWPQLQSRFTERALIAATWLMPLGFLAGGYFAQDGDPGASVALAAAGGLLLVLALGNLALRSGREMKR